MNTKAFSTSAFLSCMVWFLCSFDTENSSKDENETVYDVIIVPGVPYDHPSYKLVMKARILWAKYLYKKGIAKNIIFSGSSVYTPYVEGDIMCMYASALGIPSEHVFSETKAEHSTENVHYSLVMAKKLGFKKIALATDPYQTFMLKKYVKKNCPELGVLKINYEKINMFNASWPTIDPTYAYVNSFVSLVDRESRIKRLKGTMGKNIKSGTNDSPTCAIEIKLNVFSTIFPDNDSIYGFLHCEPIAAR